MNYIYEQVENSLGEKMIKRTDSIGNVAWVPIEPANFDYQAYLKSLDEASTL
jgi:hypothetical protein